MLALIILIFAGLLAGTLAGLLGIGGGLVVVPAVTWLLTHQGMALDQAVPVAVATSLGSMLLTAPSSIYSHHRLGGIDWACTARLGMAVAVGALLGAWLALALPGASLARVFAVVAAVIGVRMLLATRTPVAALPATPRGWWLAGPVIGAVSAMVGIGGGSFNVPYLVRNGYPMARAVAIAAACGYPIALAGSAGFVVAGAGAVQWPGMLGYWYLPGVVLIGLAGALTAPLGARLAHRLPTDLLRRIFGLLLLLIALRMAV